MNQSKINKSNLVRYLGLLITVKLNWSTHAQIAILAIG